MLPNLTNDTTILEIIDLHPNEMRLLRMLRNKYKFGDITIIMQDGVPMGLRRITEFDKLG